MIGADDRRSIADARDGADERVAGRYRILERIGTGGMATVYRALDEQLDRDVALKVFRQDLATAADLQRQQGEMRILARLTHPSLVTLYDAVSDDDGRVALVLEYVPGSDVRRRLADGPLAPRAVAAIGRDVARALAHIHDRGIVHRDVVPANILLPRRSDGRGVDAKLTDLGIARLIDDARVTSTGSVVGTAQYLSPEQAEGRAVTPASDVYSLGLVLLECLTGHPAFPGPAVESALARIANDPAIPDELDAGWRELLAAMTRREADERPSADDVAARLAELVATSSDRPLRAAPTGSGTHAPTTGRAAAFTATGSTKVLPTPTTARTERLAPVSATMPPPARRAPVRPRILIGLGIALAAIAAILIAILVPKGGTAPAPAPTYPAVPGQLGDHLGQLEQDVDPAHAP